MKPVVLTTEDCFRLLPNIEVQDFECDCGAKSIAFLLCWGSWAVGLEFCRG